MPDNVSMEPKPIRKPGIPILMGGRADAVLKRSAEEADVWIAGGQGTPEAFREAWQTVCAYAQAAGYRYDGLYRVAEYWRALGKARWYIWRFRLVKL